MTIVRVRDKKYDLSQMERRELLDLKSDVDESMSLIKVQLLEAKSMAASEGIYADPDWYKRASIALSARRRVSQNIQTELGERKTERNKSYTQSFEQHFIDAARDLLHKETLRTLFNEAQERADLDL